MAASRPTAICAALLLAAAAQSAFAQRLSYQDLSGGVPDDGPQLDYEVAQEAPAPAAKTPDAATASEPAKERGFLQYGLLDRLEWIPRHGQDSYSWDLSGFLGGPTNRLWLSSVGDGTAGGSLDYLELQALFSRSVSGWDLQAGLRYDARPHPQRVYATAGIQGDATDRLWLAAYAYLSHEGELSGRINAQYNQPIIGALVLQPSFELDAYATDVPELGIGSGLAFGEAGLRLRYEIAAAFAPYVGISWERSFGRTASFARAAGEAPASRSLVLGIRSEF